MEKLENPSQPVSYYRTHSGNSEFQLLVGMLDEDLRIRDGADHAYYAQFNKTDKIKYAILALDQNIPVGCGAIREFSPHSMEVKRMYVLNNRRGEGIATGILNELEKWTLELGKTSCILETGKKQPEALSLYLKNGYRIIPNFGPYLGVENSVCFEKFLLKA